MSTLPIALPVPANNGMYIVSYVAPTRSATQLMSTLPIALAVPANNGKYMVSYVAPTRSATQLMSTLPTALAVPANNGKRVSYICSSNYIEVLHKSCPPFP